MLQIVLLYGDKRVSTLSIKVQKMAAFNLSKFRNVPCPCKSMYRKLINKKFQRKHYRSFVMEGIDVHINIKVCGTKGRFELVTRRMGLSGMLVLPDSTEMRKRNAPRSTGIKKIDGNGRRRASMKSDGWKHVRGRNARA